MGGEKIDGDQSSRDEEDHDLINNPNIYQGPPNGDIGRKLKLDQIDNGYCQTPIIDSLRSYASRFRASSGQEASTRICLWD